VVVVSGGIEGGHCRRMVVAWRQPPAACEETDGCLYHCMGRELCKEG